MIVMCRPVAKLTQCSTKFITVKLTEGENLRVGHVTPQNVIIAAECNTNTKCNNINAKCDKNINANCNNFPTQNVITFLAQNVITQILVTLELQVCSA